MEPLQTGILSDSIPYGIFRVLPQQDSGNRWSRMDSAHGMCIGFRRHPYCDRIRSEQYIAEISQFTSEQHIWMAYVPCDDGLVQELVRQDRHFRFLYDTFKLRYLHCPLSGNRHNRLFPEGKDAHASRVHIYPSYNCSIYTLSTAL